MATRANSIKPAWAILEYDSILFTLCWNTAVMLPINNVAAVIIDTSNCHCLCTSPKQPSNKRMKAIKPATFTMVAIKEVNTVGEPSYASGVQKWNGAADTLN